MDPSAQFDNSIGKAHSAILDALRGAGEVGLPLNDLVEILGATGQNKMVLMRLRDLQNRKEVVELPNDSWKIKGPNDPEFGFASGPGSQGPPGQPSINLPGSPKYSNYKNSLQEYCQKNHAAVPVYKSTRGPSGCTGTVTFMGNTYTAATAASNPKDADQRAAFAALIGLGYLKSDATFSPPVQTIAGSKRSSTSGMDCNTPSKQACPNGASTGGTPGTPLGKTAKSALNELAQRNKLNQPTYEIVHTSNGFFCTVTFNGRQFKSMKSCTKKKDAEQSAAEVAYTFLTCPQENGFHNASATETAADVSDMIKTARVASTKEVMKLSLKNRLQEYCQRLKKPLPVYETIKQEDGKFSCKVTVEEKTFDGQAVMTKKDAEKMAASAALKFLGLMADLDDAKSTPPEMEL